MKHETYLQLMREKLGLPADTDFQLMQDIAEGQMRDAGYAVLYDQLTDHRFRVRVRKWAPRGQGRQFSYNEHTTSTSGYPILAAWEKWDAHRRAGRS